MTPQFSMGGGQAIFQYLGKLFGLKAFVETGVGNGDMIAFMHRVYENVYSIENDTWKYKLARRLFVYTPNVRIIFGDSGSELPRLLESTPNVPTFFWLDAHGQPGVDDGPVARELEAISRFRPNNSLIAIDDVGQGTHHDTDLHGIDTSGWVKDYRFNRIMFLHKGQYPIPQDI